MRDQTAAAATEMTAEGATQVCRYANDTAHKLQAGRSDVIDKLT